MPFGQRHIAINIYNICKGRLGSGGDVVEAKEDIKHLTKIDCFAKWSFLLFINCIKYILYRDRPFVYNSVTVYFTYISRGIKVEKMLTLAPERYTAGFCMVAKVILWCICNHCIADSIDLHNTRAVNFLQKPSKNMSKYCFSKCYIFLSKKFRIEKYGV